MSAHDDLERIIEAGTWRDLEPYVRAAPDGELGRQVRAWYRSRRAHWSKETRWRFGPEPAVDWDACMRILAIALDTPPQSAKTLGVRSWRLHPAADSGLVELATGRGPDWCNAFVEAASSIKISKDDESNLAWLARIALPLIAAGHADVPSGPNYAKSWAAYYSADGARAKWLLWRESNPRAWAASATDRQPPPVKLVDRLREDPALSEGVAAVIAVPGAIAPLETYSTPGWDFPSAVTELVAEGRLDRTQVRDDALAALTRNDTATAQRALARILEALQLDAIDLQDRMPFVQSLMSTCRGRVTAALLAPALNAAGPQDVLDLATTVFSRPEKAQRTVVLRALTARDALDRWGQEAVVAALTLAVEVPDQAFSAKAVSALASMGVETPQRSAETAPSLGGLWSEAPRVPAAAAVEPIDPNEEAMTTAVSRLRSGVGTPAASAVFWDAAVRWFATSPDQAQEWVASTFARDEASHLPPTTLETIFEAPAWAVGTHVEICEQILTTRRVPRTRDNLGIRFVGLPIMRAFEEVYTSEVRTRLGDIPFLLSTPTREDGRLDLETLVDRIRGYRGVQAGPIDLFLALMRLGPVEPGTVGKLDGLELPLWCARPARRTLLGRRKQTQADGIDVVRRWLTGGGVPPVVVRHDSGSITTDALELRVEIEAFYGVPPDLLDAYVPEQKYSWDHFHSAVICMFPTWGDFFAARSQRHFDQAARWETRTLSTIAASSCPGSGVTHIVAATLCHADQDHRLIGVEAALTMIGRGHWDPDAYTGCCLHMLADGQLRLGRLAHAWEQLILAGGLQLLWPSVVAVLDAAASADRKPSGLSDILAMVNRYVSAVPDPRLPRSLEALAQSKGSSKSKVEAEALVTAATRSPV